MCTSDKLLPRVVPGSTVEQRRFQTHLLCQLWTSGKRVCVTELLPERVPGSAVDRLRAGSHARGRAAYTPTRSLGCTQALFQRSACAQAACEDRL